MNILNFVNLITVLIACIFIVPILIGIIKPLTSSRFHRSFVWLFNCIIFFTAIILSAVFTKTILSGYDDAILDFFYGIIPGFKDAVLGKEIWLYPIIFSVLTVIICLILRLLLIPVYKFALDPMSHRLSKVVNSMNKAGSRTIGGIWKVPGSILLVLIFSAFIYIFTCFFSTPSITDYIDSSTPYINVQDNIIKPIFDKSLVSDIRVLLDDSLKSEKKDITDVEGKNKFQVYLNGMIIGDAVKSNTEIDTKAKEITKSGTGDRDKAYLVYAWVCRNIKYDYDKSVIIKYDPSKAVSGAIETYNTKKGVCFDFSSLYVAMCRAAGLKVRMMTGYGYTGKLWVDHVWNEVYCTGSETWINLDTTFGVSGINYFNSPYFDIDHRDGDVQGEW